MKSQTLTAGPVVDRGRRTVHVAGRELELTCLQFELLDHFVSHPGQVFRREQLLASVWGFAVLSSRRTVDVQVARLRSRLGPKHRGAIVTVRGVGYKYAP
ncbi:winged helix-turn-helix domain-containing protein [Streptacidiphilus sp. EB129]|uniref:winged helix-turn-helix domain-containing protein n=1 Tax=Streptacidiphilus sp. EB129 TaxID=3156262 RepID=UPI00351435C2